jgi:hypothetical protein
MKITGMRRVAAPAACALQASEASTAVAPSAVPIRKPRRPGSEVASVVIIGMAALCNSFRRKAVPLRTLSS